jgi:hypothetical protein
MSDTRRHAHGLETAGVSHILAFDMRIGTGNGGQVSETVGQLITDSLAGSIKAVTVGVNGDHQGVRYG